MLVPPTLHREAARTETSPGWLCDSVRILKEIKAKASPLPYLQHCAEAALKVLNLSITLEHNDDCLRIARRVADITEMIAEEAPRVEGAQEVETLKKAIATYTAVVEEVERFLTERAGRSPAYQLLSGEKDGKELQRLFRALDQGHYGWVERSMGLLREDLRAERNAPWPASPSRDIIFPRSPCILRLPPKPRVFFGREALVAPVLAAVADGTPARFGLLGGGGMGKSTAALRIIHDATVETQFGSSRYFVRCDGVKDSRDMLGAMANELGLKGENLAEQFWSCLSRPAPVFLCLDNLEMCLDEDKAAIEEVLTRISRMTHVTLLITSRGSTLPYGPEWTKPYLPLVEPLDEDSARKTFLAISPTEDPELGNLLEKLCCIPLAVTLAAVLTHEDETPTSLLIRWHEETTSLLDRGQQHREMSVDFSIRLSLESSRMRRCPDALKLLSLTSRLPDGILAGKLLLVSPKTLKCHRAAAVLCTTALAQKDDRHDLRMHALIRDYIRTYHPPEATLLGPLESYYLEHYRFEHGPQNKSDADKMAAMVPELDNAQHVLMYILKAVQERRQNGSPITTTSSITAFTVPLATAVVGVGFLRWWSGVSSIRNWDLALEEAQYAGKECHGLCLFGVGLAMTDQRTAPIEIARTFQQALSIFREIGHSAWSSDCAQGAASHFWRLGLYKKAENALEEALHLSQGVDDTRSVGWCFYRRTEWLRKAGKVPEAMDNLNKGLGCAKRSQDECLEALCLKELAELRMDQGQCAEAQAAARDAAVLAKALHYNRLALFCSWIIGEALVRQGDYTSAERTLKVVLAESQRADEVKVETRCLGSLVEVKLALQDVAAAHTYVRQVLEKAHAIGSKFLRVQGEKLFGDCYRFEQRCDDARQHYEAALKEGKGMGWTILSDIQHALESLPKGSVYTTPTHQQVPQE